MSDTINITLVGHSSTGLNAIEAALQDELDLDLSRKLMLEGAVDPFEELPSTTQVVVLDLGAGWRETLLAVSNRSSRRRPPLILIGPAGSDTEMMRLGLRAGARDFQIHPVSPVELATVIRQIGNERPESIDGALGELCVFISSKGGAGASAIATGVAHSLRLRDEQPNVLLMDLDLQYGNLPLYLDESSNTKLTQALIGNERVDPTLLDACLIRTGAGIDVLASHSDQVFSAWETPQQSVSNLLNLVCGRYDHVVVDIPRQIDPVSFQAIERATRICVVMQQSLSDLRYTRQILALLRDQGIATDKLMIVLNRHDKHNVIRAIDVADAFDGLAVVTVPNDYKRMSHFTENGVSLMSAPRSRKSPIGKSLVALTDRLWPPKAPAARRGLFRRRERTAIATR